MNEAKLRLLRRYGSLREFTEAFHLRNMMMFAKDPVRCVTGDSPTLHLVLEVYGREGICVWLSSFIESLATYCGEKGMSMEKCKMCAEVILTSYGRLRVAEVMLFFCNVRAGRYGHFYGSLDLMTLVSWIPRFIEESKLLWSNVESRREPCRQLELLHSLLGDDMNRPMSRDEYLCWCKTHPEQCRRVQELIEQGFVFEGA